ncbi:MAG: ubiquinol-cytochrome C chaperone, partial [Mesorhizobium sp.]
DRDGLTAALARNVRPDAGAWLEAPLLADYVIDAGNQLATQPSDSIVSGTLVFPVAKGD